MYRKILVPLDGSKLAECALPHAVDMAKAYSAEMVLVSVTEEVEGFRAVSDASQPHEERLVPEAGGKLEEQARKYLDRIAAGIAKEGVEVTTEVQFGKPADGIMVAAMLYDCDVIVMSSHGRSGVSKWTHGSVAEKVFRVSHTPVLMIPAAGCKALQS
jgi:nucleotide-binding universal stress UspA family protein